MQLPKKAIIAVAGSGTRFLPATKAVPKEMLPIVDKPIAQYCVEEAINSGVKDVVLVTKEGNEAIKNHFETSPDLEKQLKESGKKDKLKIIKDVAKMANFVFVEQTNKMPYGSATPLRIAADKVRGGPFFYLLGDDMTLSKMPVCRQLAEVYKKNPDAAAVIAVQKIPREVAYRYGIVKFKKGTKNEYESIVEKPKLGEEPSLVASFGRYLFTPKILPIVRELKIGKGNELWVIDAINELAKTEKVIVYEIKGKWMTTGDPLNYLMAMVDFVWERDDLKAEFRNYIVEKLGK